MSENACEIHATDELSPHPEPHRWARPLWITAGVAYLRRDEYRHMDAADEEAFLRDLVETEQAKPGKNTSVIDV